MCVFDLDPGPGTSIAECADVGLDIRHVLDGLGLAGFAKTSGSKGMQVYVPLNTPSRTRRRRRSPCGWPSCSSGRTPTTSCRT